MILMAFSIFGGYSVNTYNMKGIKDSVFMKGVDSFYVQIIRTATDSLKVYLPRNDGDTILAFAYKGKVDTIKIKWFIPKNYTNGGRIDTMHYPIQIGYYSGSAGIPIDTAWIKMLPPDFSIINFGVSKLGNPTDSTNFLPGDTIAIKWNYKYPSLFDTATTSIIMSVVRGIPNQNVLISLIPIKKLSKADTSFEYVVMAKDTFTNVRCQIILYSNLYEIDGVNYHREKFYFGSNVFSFDPPITKVLNPIISLRKSVIVDNRVFNVLGQKTMAHRNMIFLKNNQLFSITR